MFQNLNSLPARQSRAEIGSWPQSDSELERLSARELECARLVAKGFSNKEVGQLLEISPWTVNTYLRRIFAKLGVTSRAEMVASSMNAGLVQTVQTSS